MPMTPADFGKLIADETEKWGKVIKYAGIKPGDPNMKGTTRRMGQDPVKY